MITFERTTVDNLSLQSKHYLQQAIKRTPASTARLDTSLEMAKRFGNLYNVIDDGILTGCIWNLIYDTQEGKVLSPVLVGGKNIKKWRDDLYDMLLNEASRVGAVAVRFVARKGWHKMYPMGKNIGTIYEYKVMSRA